MHFSVNISKVGKHSLNWCWWNWIYWTFCVVDLHSGSIISLMMVTPFAYFLLQTATCKKFSHMEFCGLSPLYITKGWISNNNHSISSIFFYNLSQHAGMYRCDTMLWSWESVTLLQIKFRLAFCTEAKWSHILTLYNHLVNEVTFKKTL